MFCAYLIDRGHKSATTASYVSAIKAVLKDDGYDWCDGKILISALTRACKIQNDVVKRRLPIQKKLLEILLFEIKRINGDQQCLQVMYEAMLCLGYYGLMRVGELTDSPHVVKATNIHIGTNKDKILIVLYSSKTHTRASPPQKIKITSVETCSGIMDHTLQRRKGVFFCPFVSIRNYLSLRGTYKDQNENFFVFKDKSPV